MKYNIFNFNINANIDIPFLRIGHIQDAEAEINVLNYSIKNYERDLSAKTDIYTINGYPHYIITIHPFSNNLKTGELAIYTDSVNIFYELVSGKSFSLLLLKLNYFILHASAIVWNENAYLFSGHTHVGKSTFAFAAQKFLGATVLCDDIAPIKNINGQLYVFPGAAKIKMRSSAIEKLTSSNDLCSDSYIIADERNYLFESKNRAVPIKAIIFLNRNPMVQEFNYNYMSKTKTHIYLSMNTYARSNLPPEFIRTTSNFIKCNLDIFNCVELIYPDNLELLKNIELP